MRDFSRLTRSVSYLEPTEGHSDRIGIGSMRLFSAHFALFCVAMSNSVTKENRGSVNLIEASGTDTEIFILNFKIL